MHVVEIMVHCFKTFWLEIVHNLHPLFQPHILREQKCLISTAVSFRFILCYHALVLRSYENA